MLNLVSFVGVDETTSQKTLSNLQHVRDGLSHFKPIFDIELGFLYSEGRAGKQTRYPSTQFIDDYLYDLSYSPFKTSLHLCGQEAINKFFDRDANLLETCRLAGRIQLNLNMNNFTADEAADKIIDLSEDFKLIIQDNKSKAELIAALAKRAPFNSYESNINYLYDSSGGYGKLIENFKPVHKHNYTGYAGNINPFNVLDIVKSIEYHNETDTPFYVDMESGIRTDDKLDVNKCLDIILNLYHYLNFRNNS